MSDATKSQAPSPFPRLDPATSAFWDARFAAGFMPWDRGGVPANLQSFIAAHQKAKLNSFIPGCGAAHEVSAFAAADWPVTAIDFSPVAIQRANAQLGMHRQRIEVADFFDARWISEGFDLIYERAFLCALTPALRTNWAIQVSAILRPKGLLAGYFYLADTRNGPPFGMQRSILDDLLAPCFTLVEESVPPDSIEVFRGCEKWMVWERTTTGCR